MKSRSNAFAPLVRAPTVCQTLVVTVIGLLFSSPAGAQHLKPPLSGLIYMGKIGFHNEDQGVPDNSLAAMESAPGLFNAVVINITWAQLQPAPNSFVTSSLDASLQSVRDYNRRHPQTALAVKLRIWGGPNAPFWVKNLGGPPIAVSHRSLPITVGRFWSEPYNRAWRDLQDRLGSRYDSDPLIRTVGNAACASKTDEPFNLPADPQSLPNLHKAGFSDSEFRRCLSTAYSDYSHWLTTPIEYPFNPFRATDSGAPRPDRGFAIQVMIDWRRKLGARGVIANHSLQSPPAPGMVPIYNEIRTLGAPIQFQTHAPNSIDWAATFQYGISLGASAIEIWNETRRGSYNKIPPREMFQWSADLRHNKSM
jgi:hypothetical protein